MVRGQFLKMEGVRSFAGRMKFGMWARTGCIAAFIFMLSYSANGQIPNLSDKARWVHFSSSAGLPPSEITGIYESWDSTLWVATLAGIAWFDGFRWRRSDGFSALPANGAYYFKGEYRDSIVAYCEGVYYLGNRNGFRLFLAHERDSSAFAGDSSEHTMARVIFALCRDSRSAGDLVPIVKKITGFFPTKWGDVWVTLPDGMYHDEGNRWKNRLPRSGEQFALGAISVSENKQGSGLCLIRSPAEQMGMW